MPHRLAAALVTLAVAAVASSARAAPSYAVSDHLKGADGSWDYTSFDPGRGRVFVSRGGSVTVVDVATKAVTSLTVPGGGKTHESLPLNGGALLLVTDSTANAAHLIDPASGAEVAAVPTGGQKPDAAVFDSASGLALVMNGKSGDVTFIDPAAHTAVATVAVGGALEFAAVDGAGRAFVNIEDQNQIAVIDTKAHTVVGHYALAGCDGPSGLIYAPGTTSGAGVLIAACANKVAKVLNAADGHDLATLTIGAGPDAVIYDPARKLAFIPCGRNGVLEVIAVRGPQDVAIVQTVTTQVGARTGAVDPASGTLYLPTAKYQPAPGGGKPTPVPGTFEILVVTPAGG